MRNNDVKHSKMNCVMSRKNELKKPRPITRDKSKMIDKLPSFLTPTLGSKPSCDWPKPKVGVAWSPWRNRKMSNTFGNYPKKFWPNAKKLPIITVKYRRSNPVSRWRRNESGLPRPLWSRNQPGAMWNGHPPVAKPAGACDVGVDAVAARPRMANLCAPPCIWIPYGRNPVNKLAKPWMVSMPFWWPVANFCVTMPWRACCSFRIC
mmetsp:Transcript_17283/g.35804  ORF Transcript_17283/g.35804 Transcript_17283/m.35804 type:complete len:206 (+) Transcript_17283:428-1045(+)